MLFLLPRNKFSKLSTLSVQIFVWLHKTYLKTEKTIKASDLHINSTDLIAVPLCNHVVTQHAILSPDPYVHIYEKEQILTVESEDLLSEGKSF